MPKRQYSFTMDDETHALLFDHAEGSRRSMSGVLEILVWNVLAKSELEPDEEARKRNAPRAKAALRRLIEARAPQGQGQAAQPA